MNYKVAMRPTRVLGHSSCVRRHRPRGLRRVRPARAEDDRSRQGHLPLHLEAVRRRRARRQRGRDPLERRRPRLRRQRHAGVVGAVLAEIRQLTTQPVRYVVNSHWHWDHWYGTETYTQRVPRREGGRAREDARDDGGAGDRVQPPGPRIAAARLRRSRSKRRSRPSRSSSRCSTRTASSSNRRRTRTWSLPDDDVQGSAVAAPRRPRDRGAAPRPRGHAGRHVPLSARRKRS